MTEWAIEAIGLEEAGVLAGIGRQTFIDTFASANDPADINAYVAKAFSPEQIRRELSDPDVHAYFARSGDAIGGYIKLNSGTAQTEKVDGNTLEVERIYVASNWQGTGLGKVLMEYAISRARELHCHAIWLGVWEHNTKAISFYERRGFVSFGRHDFLLGTDAQTDILMRLAL